MSSSTTHNGGLVRVEATAVYSVFSIASGESKSTKEETVASPKKQREEIFLIAPRIIELEKANKLWIVFEYFPPKTQQGVDNLIERFGRMKRHNPLYYDVTWGAGGSTSDLTVDLCIRIQKEFGMTANMHVTCTNMDRVKLDIGLTRAKEAGIRNIVCLRGDPPVGQKDWKPVESGFSCALDLVRYLRQMEREDGYHFGITVSGYPEGHPERIKQVQPGQVLSKDEEGRSSTRADGTKYTCSDQDFEAELVYLKQKQDAGADMIVTQLFFDTKVFIDFVTKCRAFGITIPIIPGIMCISAYGGFTKMVSFCQTRVPEDMLAAIEAVKEDAAKLKDLGIELGTKMCRELLASGAHGLHFFTLNSDTIVDGILANLNLSNVV